MEDWIISGDTHGDARNICELIDLACSMNCLGVVVCGDFGYFPNLVNTNNELIIASKYAEFRNKIVYFLKGNHENHAELAKHSTITELYKNIFYLPNNTVIKLGEYNVGIMGGAYSIDSWRRVEGIDWFKNEMISNEDVENCMGNVDILLSHDAPLNNDGIDEYLEHDMDANTLANRLSLQKVVNKVSPKLIIHGHYHLRRFFECLLNTGTKIPCISLDCNFNINFQWILLSEAANRIKGE